jgi:hypothetical protein
VNMWIYIFPLSILKMVDPNKDIFQLDFNFLVLLSGLGTLCMYVCVFKRQRLLNVEKSWLRGLSFLYTLII